MEREVAQVDCFMNDGWRKKKFLFLEIWWKKIYVIGTFIVFIRVCCVLCTDCESVTSDNKKLKKSLKVNYQCEKKKKTHRVYGCLLQVTIACRLCALWRRWNNKIKTIAHMSRSQSNIKRCERFVFLSSSLFFKI